MTNIILPRAIIEQALRALNMSDRVFYPETKIAIAQLAAALEQPQDHSGDAANMVPAGWKLVPVDPTRDMLTNWIKADVVSNWTAPGIYRAMLAAAPKPPEAVTDCHQLEQPQVEQEPVATLSIEVTGPMTKIDFGWDDPLRQLPAGEYKLYLRPQPKREPLTDGQIKDIVRGVTWASAMQRDGSTSHRIARAIEREHGICQEGGAA